MGITPYPKPCALLLSLRRIIFSSQVTASVCFLLCGLMIVLKRKKLKSAQRREYARSHFNSLNPFSLLCSDQLFRNSKLHSFSANTGAIILFPRRNRAAFASSGWQVVLIKKTTFNLIKIKYISLKLYFISLSLKNQLNPSRGCLSRWDLKAFFGYLTR